MSNEEVIRRYFLLRKLCNFTPARAMTRAIYSQILDTKSELKK